MPTSRAVRGSTCISPRAPAKDTSPGSKPLSWYIWDTTSRQSNPCSATAALTNSSKGESRSPSMR